MTRSHIDNMAGALLLRPETVIFIGDNSTGTQSIIDLYRELLREKGITTELLFKSVNRNDLKSTVRSFEEILTEYPSCTFDLRGGDEVYLVAIGCLLERYPHDNVKTHGKNIQCHRFNFDQKSIQDNDNDGTVCRVDSYDLRLEDYLSLSGGRILMDRQGQEYTYPWELTDELNRRVSCLWDLCEGTDSDPQRKLDSIGRWNSTINTLDKVSQYLLESLSGLTLTFSVSAARAALKERGDKYFLSMELLTELKRNRYLTQLSVSEDTVTLTFCDDEMKRILTQAGQILELRVAMALRRTSTLKSHREIPVFHDIRVGVHIDWNEDDDAKEFQTVNEIDVLAMKGAIPVFISCKNGGFTVDELYKLDTVARRFGGDYAVRVLVASSMKDISSCAYIRARARDMGIILIENDCVWNFNALKDALKDLK